MDPLTNRVIKVSIPRSSLDSIPTSFATVSLGKPSDSLLLKLSAISSAGFKGVELGFPDLVSFASEYHKKEIKEDDYDRLCEAGKGVKMICEQSNLRIIMLQPFSNFEGWKKGSKERKEAFERAKGWIRVMQSVGTDMLQVGSSDSPNISTSKEDIVSDIRELADMLAEHKLRLAYENWCWSTHACVFPLSALPNPREH
jgi:sugar phosphate isomerase/epimerase